MRSCDPEDALNDLEIAGADAEGASLAAAS